MTDLPPIDDNLLQGPGLAALSGGADSVALFRLLCERGTVFTALHCNFHLRGAESDRDEAFVRGLCDRLGIPLAVKHFSTLAFAREQKISVEMAARRLRYEWFDQELHRTGARWIAVAHHRDDQAETILLNLLRGTGPAGLGGMRPRCGHIVRPLLGWHKQDILNYLGSIGQDFVTDSTNLEREARRNVLRLDVMPLLRQINPQAVDHICRAGELVRSLTDEAETDGMTLGELHQWLHPLGFTLSQQRDIHRHQSGPSGAVWLSPTHRLLRDRGQLVAEPRTETAMPAVSQEIVEVDHAPAWLARQPKDATLAYLDADLLSLPLGQRRIKAGDRFQPYGMKGTKLVSDVLTNLKLSRFQKERQTVMTSGADICWLTGLRSDHRFRVTASTRRVMVLKVTKQTEHAAD